MVKITHEDLGIQDENLARRVLVRARTIAPCIDSVVADSDIGRDILAILRGVASEATDLPPRSLRATGVGPMREEYRDVASCFSPDDVESLRYLCGSPDAESGLPLGSFPEDDTLGRLWPERYA